MNNTESKTTEPNGIVSERMDIGVIGTGEFASYLIDGFMRDKADTSIIVSPRGREHSAQLAKRYGVRIARDNAEVVACADMVLIATRPAQLIEAIANVPWRAGQLAISVAAGISHKELSAQVAPADAVLCMPTNSAMIGASILPMYPAHHKAGQLLKALGEPVVMPNESAFEASAVLGAHYGFVLALLSTTCDWLTQHGIATKEARLLSSRLFESVGKISAHRSEKGLQELVGELRLPGGITEFGLVALAEKQTYDSFSEVLTGVLNRLNQRY
ncbi:MAG: pyrroline-5-carboxylate reductase [marine bacterium B5-7]|nr:MAG: pyrroline-5-carboxylate reductase [marine bacterium B5-7]